mgnify:CR=1 FL=1
MVKDFRRAVIIWTALIAGGFVVFAVVIYFLSSAVSAQAKKISDLRIQKCNAAVYVLRRVYCRYRNG